jgi:hypothetical protein
MKILDADGNEVTGLKLWWLDPQRFYAIVVLSGLFAASWWMLSQWSAKFGSVVGIPWLLIASLLPAVLVLNHALSVQWLPPKGNDPADAPPAGGNAAANANTAAQLQVQKLIQQEYSSWAIGINYYLPTFALAVAGLVVALLACQPPNCCGPIDTKLLDGLRFGALGAYVYVLMTLCERSFRNDISPGLAQWSAGQLILGPLLGGVLATVLLPSTTLSQFSQQVLYFVAGLAPRQLLAFIGDTATRFFANTSEVRVKAIIPLSAIGGITTRVEDRLFEEGIEDTYQLAMSNPIRLTRDTPYEMAQLVDWIDRAQLHATLPDGAARLQGQGIRGAIDLARLGTATDGKPFDLETLAGQPYVKQLAGDAHLNEKVLANLIVQTAGNPQVQLLSQIAAISSH